MDDTRLDEYIDANEQRLVETALDLLAFDTQNPPGETTAIVEYVGRELVALGMDTTQVGDEDAPGIVGWFPTQPDPDLVFLGHLDTVPFERVQWSVDPLGERDGDVIYGRGATDMKGAVAAMLSVARAFEETAGSAPDVGFVFTTDEETGGEATLSEALETFETPPEACLIGEMSGTPNRPSLAIADKGSIWLTLQAFGEPAHGSRPVLGANAIDTLYETVDELREELQEHRFDLHPDVDRILTQSVAYYAPTIGEQAAWELFEFPTVNLGTFSGGTAINSVPVSATAALDIRLTASVAVEPIVKQVRTYITSADGVEVASLEWSEGTYERPDAPLVTAVQTAGESLLDGRLFARSATGGGDAKTLRQQGISTVEFALGTETAHAVDERTTVTALSQTAKIYGTIPLLWSEK